jgi:type 1 glutamine amidotransferase
MTTRSLVRPIQFCVMMLIGSLYVAPEALAQAACFTETAPAGSSVLVFSRTAAFRHGSIPTGVAALKALGTRHGFAVEHSEDSSIFTPAQLARFGAIVFLSTTGDVLDEAQQSALQSYIRGGGGYVGIHAASDTEHDWPWYGQLAGAYFSRHPRIQPANVVINDATHPSTKCLPAVWSRTDEWYDFKAQPASTMKILASLDESSYQGGEMGANHPIAWYHEFEGGRAWYTGLGHTNESYAEPAFLDHLAGGILWALKKP